MNAKKLTDFINETSYKPTLTTFSKGGDIITKSQVDMHEVPSNDAPILFVGRNVNELRLSKDGVQEILDSFHNFKDLTEHQEESTIEAVEEEFIEDEVDIIPEVIAQTSSKESKKIKARYKEKYHKSPEMEKLSKQKSLSISLRAYLDCCVQNGMINRGYLTLTNYRFKFQKMAVLGIKISDVDLYNILIHGYAEKENLMKVNDLMNIVRIDQLQPNAQTFANYLECLGRLARNPAAMAKHHIPSQSKLVSIINKAIEDAAHHKIKLNDIIDDSIFLNDQREVVLNAIRLAVPDFKPTYTPPSLLYDNAIMNPLNKHVKEISYNQIEHINENLPGSEIMKSKEGFTRDELERMAREQLETEMNGFIKIKSIQKFPEPTPNVLKFRAMIETFEKSWREKINASLNRDMDSMRSEEFTKARGKQNLLPYLRALDQADFVEILIREIRILAGGSDTYSPSLKRLYKDLGNKVQLRYQMHNKEQNGILQKTGEIYGNFCEILSSGTSSDNPRQCWQRLVFQKSNEGPSMNFSDRSWPAAAQIGIGRFLYNILMRDLKIDVNCLHVRKSKTENLMPAFYSLFRNQGKLVREEVKPHPILVKLYHASQSEDLTFEVNQVPMLCPPQPWHTSRNGGYLLAKSDLIRLPQTAQQQIDRIEKTPLSHLYPSLDSLNQLGSIAWTVNKDLLDVILHVFNSGGNDKLTVPEPPSSLEAPVAPSKESELTKQQKFELYRLKMNHKRKQGEMFSLWCDALYRLSLANHYRDRVFWLPHNMDFRGRVYPIPPHLNHIGGDLARSLLVFHRKKKLGVDGFMWLKLHCINLTGLKKRDSVRERLLYVEQIMDDILDSADNPLDGRGWWKKSDEPWQTLSACMEIAKVTRSGDPENFESGYPIHQDGSCNGLQHYAALGRDAAGAYSVNLVPTDVPQDVYGGIAELVEKTRQKDEENGVEVARVLRSFVRRKVIKQTVMTTVYGVTRYGARLQIAKQLKALDDFPKHWVWSASSYLTSKTFDSLRKMFTSTKEIQDWFTDCARHISSVCGQNVEWITPLGLPVVQPYNRHEKHNDHLSKNTKIDAFFAIDAYCKPNIMKQKNAFPPNFIHSLDSSHMMLTSLYCEKNGLTFISVHDCFWTHACTVPDMNKVCREQFVALHSGPILEDLSKYLTHKYSFKKK